MARQAVDRGADLLGVAGGDGTQALVAGIAESRCVQASIAYGAGRSAEHKSTIGARLGHGVRATAATRAKDS